MSAEGTEDTQTTCTDIETKTRYTFKCIPLRKEVVCFPFCLIAYHGFRENHGRGVAIRKI